jgi:deoxycytidylate deaminase
MRELDTIMFVRDSCSKQLDSDRLAAYVPEVGKHSRNSGRFAGSDGMQLGEAVDEAFMRMAVAEAEEALRLGEVPVGCVIVHDGDVVARLCACKRARCRACAEDGGSVRRFTGDTT